jgi:HK97 family phage major capsid protein
MPQEKPVPEVLNRTLRREFTIDARSAKIAKDERTVEFSFSSEFPVERWFGKEILSHAPNACDLGRMNAGANALFNHRMDHYVGVVKKAWIGDDKRGYCEVRFSKGDQAEKIYQDVMDEVLRNVSFGYVIEDLVLSRQGKDGQDSEYTATRWQPYEVSFVTVPADPTVGMGRSAGKDDAGLVALVARANELAKPPPEVVIEEKTAVQPAQEERNKMPEVQPVDEKQVRSDAVKAERERSKAITTLCEKHKMPADLARELIDGDKSLEDARAIVLEKIGRAQVPVTGHEAEIGLSAKEIRQFSFLNIVRAQMEPANRKAQEAAAFEREISEATQKVTGKAARGFLVPFDVLRSPLSQRDLVVGTSTAGGNLVATDLLMGSFIEILRNKSALIAAGAQVLTGLVGNIAIPRQTGGATAYWVGEGSAPTESQQAFDQVTMGPKTVGAFTDYSRKLMLQTSMDVEAFVRGDLAAVLALEIDRVGLYGSGSANQPLGLKDTSGLNTTDLAAAAPTWAEIVGMETKVNAANADIGVMKYLTNANGKGALKTTVKVAGYPVFLMGDDNNMNGYPVLGSNQVASGDFWFGVWNQLVMGFWSGLDVLVDPYTGSTSGNVRVVAHQDCDVAARHAVSFTRANDTL